MAADTFETSEDAAGWLRKPHPLLDEKTPLEMAQTAAGAQQVRSMLVAIRYGGVA
jgi:putative toxin-antitoxin system antitoxin component (TIGR02293 family)